jgi:mannose-1-phosphate guanylyltransferase
MLDLWLDSLARAGVDEVLINLHHLPDIVEKHLQGRAGPPEVVTVFEPQLLGSAGTLRANRSFVSGEDCFMVCYADNLTDFDLTKLLDFHSQHGGIATLGLFHAPVPEACGIVELDRMGRVTGFTEKPPHPASDLANAGMYVFHPAVIDEIEDSIPSDIGFDLLPRLIGGAWAMPIDGYFRDIGTVEAYERAQHEWQPRALR